MMKKNIVTIKKSSLLFETSSSAMKWVTGTRCGFLYGSWFS